MKAWKTFFVVLIVRHLVSAGVLFRSDFEDGSFKSWDERTGMCEVVKDSQHGGKKCLRITKTLGKNTGGDLKKWFLPGADQVFVRFYVKFANDYSYPHHFVTLMGSSRANKWAGFGKAGLKPDGTYFSTGMEPWFAWGKNPPPGEISFYSYFTEGMEIDRKMNKYWGNSFFPPGPGRGAAASESRVIPKRGEWQCWEFMLKANTPGKADGEQAMWIDGKSVGRFTEIAWRSSGEVKANCLWLQHYGYDSSDPTRGFWKRDKSEPFEDTVWFDDVVVGTEYIGPMEAQGSSPVAPKIK